MEVYLPSFGVPTCDIHIMERFALYGFMLRKNLRPLVEIWYKGCCKKSNGVVFRLCTCPRIIKLGTLPWMFSV